MPTIPPSVAPLPPPPDPNNRGTFNTLALPWSLAQQTLATDLTALGANVYSNAVEAEAKAGAASLSASSASTQALNAGTSATLAESWATSTGVVSGGLYGARKYAQDALSYANDAAAIVGLFLGEKLSDPLLNNQGGPLVGGNWYVNVTPGSEAIRVYTGTGWIAGISAVAGVSSINGMTGNVSFTVPAGKLYYMGTA